VSIERVPLVVEMLKTLDRLCLFFLPAGLECPRRLIQSSRSTAKWIEEVKKGMDGLDDLIALDLRRRDREGLGRDVLGTLEQYEQDRGAGEPVPAPGEELPDGRYGQWWAALVRNTVSRAWQGVRVREYPELIKITPAAHAAKVKQFHDLLDQKRKLEAEGIRAHWAKRQAGNRNAPWNQILALAAGKKNGGSKTLREAVKLGLPKGLLDMRPCWLANPASVSEILPLQAGLFDVVIFDEASQCPVEQVLPAIYRGKILIVSGDEKQLPPTGFFAARV
jgi:hypothetical protein